MVELEFQESLLVQWTTDSSYTPCAVLPGSLEDTPQARMAPSWSPGRMCRSRREQQKVSITRQDSLDAL